MSERIEHMPSNSGQMSLTTLADGRYKLVEKVAEGGNAMVFRAYDTVESQWRAIKMLMPEYAQRATLLSRFQREGNTMKALDHPNIIRVYDAGGDRERAWLVMEYAEGGSVIGWVERHGRMPPRMATEVAIQLCSGISYAHHEGVIHRDVKPQNLLVDRDGVCKVTDFGIAQVLQQTRVTMTGTVMGTIGYMAPEQHESAKHADHRADVYSIAASIYTLVNGEAATHLFMADDRDFDGIPEPLARVIRKGSQYRREARYANVAEMQAAFEEILDALPPDPPGTPPLIDSYHPLPAVPREEPAVPQSLRPIEESSIEAPVELRSPVLDRTPSSIIPRDSLTSAHRRRPQIRNRDEIERQYRIRTLALAVGAMIGLTFLAVLAFAIIGKVQLQSKVGDVEESAMRLRDQLVSENHLLKMEMKRSDQFRKMLLNVQGSWDEMSDDERIGEANRIHDLIHTEQAEAIKERERKQFDNDAKIVEKDISDYQDKIQALDDFSGSPLGVMGRMLP